MSILGSTTDSWSYENSQGYGETNASSWNEGASSGTSYANTDSSSWSKEQASADSWSKVYGTAASAQDIQRAKEANDLEYKRWKETNQFNANEAAKQRAFEKEMSNTAYQRAVVDMMKAGINPILAAMNGGASTPQGSAASTTTPTTHKANTYANEESKSKSRSTGQSASKTVSRAASQDSSYSIGGSSQHGININMSSAESGSKTRDNINNIVDGVLGALGIELGGSSTHGYSGHTKGGGGGSW